MPGPRQRKDLVALLLAAVAGVCTAGFVGLSAQKFATLERSPKAIAHTVPAADPLQGLWRKVSNDEDLVRFYYFHGDGKGLYRYGKVGLTQTHSFDYRIESKRLVLRFRKEGVRHSTSFAIKAGAKGRQQLVLAQDPKEPGAVYRLDAPPITPRVLDEGQRSKGLDGLMWIHTRSFAHGGSEFGMYQFNKASIDGRGIGWFHRGDFDDWSTEALSYRIDGARLQLHFAQSPHVEHSRFSLRKGAQKQTYLQLQEDPRNFWHERRYVEAGPSFGGASPAFRHWVLPLMAHPGPLHPTSSSDQPPAQTVR